jgi:hypothetical protein
VDHFDVPAVVEVVKLTGGSIIVRRTSCWPLLELSEHFVPMVSMI